MAMLAMLLLIALGAESYAQGIPLPPNPPQLTTPNGVPIEGYKSHSPESQREAMTHWPDKPAHVICDTLGADCNGQPGSWNPYPMSDGMTPLDAMRRMLSRSRFLSCCGR